MADADALGLLPKQGNRIAAGAAVPDMRGAIARKEICGAGTVETFAIMRRAVQSEWKGKEPHVVALIQLDDGGRLFSNLIDCAPEDDM